ncbi:hypothetical protein GOP47_0004530 [Adiantum capillus-veneris]|uniref:Uncharacterized protein n=1 Tax=Adiantum capillus-veneris TaxID=13818 RepID=A0A9D4V891_ADICA|nr:hypothetical protein GOP47_0004530 [Adiantum capillus-veneris]
MPSPRLHSFKNDSPLPVELLPTSTPIYSCLPNLVDGLQKQGNTVLSMHECEREERGRRLKESRETEARGLSKLLLSPLLFSPQATVTSHLKTYQNSDFCIAKPCQQVLIFAHVSVLRNATCLQDVSIAFNTKG